MNVNTNRLLQEFSELAAIDSVSFQERQMADRVSEKLKKLGFAVIEEPIRAYSSQTENSAEHSAAGNIYGYLKGNLPGPPILLSAHLDTVSPGCGKRAILRKEDTHLEPLQHQTEEDAGKAAAVYSDDGYLVSDGTTVLGADDVSGIVEILEGIRILQEQGIAHRDIEVLFSAAEEVYSKGSAAFDYTKVHAKEAYVLDLSGPVGSAALQAPSLISFAVTIHGKASHAGFVPEEGIHAIRIAAEAIAGLEQGHLDEETTLNIGTIAGGQATNIVPESCICCGEIRSYRHERALEVLEQIRAAFEKAAHAAGGSSTLESSIDLMAYETSETAAAVQHFTTACQSLGLTPQLTKTFGGSDNNNFALHGIEGIVLSCGMEQVHSTKEYIRVHDLQLGAQLVAELLAQP